MDDDFEIGLELDRALRASVTGVAQLMERGARVRADSDRSAAAAARQDWLSERDAARRQYQPWTRPGAVEKAFDALPAAEAWAAAAAWSAMDPTAAAAERAIAERVTAAHGEHPTVLLQRVDATDMTPGATSTAPPLELDEQRAQWEAWATKAGAGEEFDVARWRDGEGTIDEAARDAALIRLWDDGSDERALLELEEHQAAMEAAGMGPLPAHVALHDPARAASDIGDTSEPAWAALLDPEAFEAAEPHEVALAWRDARSHGSEIIPKSSAAGVEGAAADLAAQAAAERLAHEIDRKYGRHPETLLRETMAERASTRTESRRDAEDAARRAGEDLGGGLAGAAGEPAWIYDRAEEADLAVLSPESRQARVSSSHGFSQSTADLLAAPAHKGTAARPTRGGPNAPKRVRGLQR